MDFENIDQLEDYLKGVADDAFELVEALRSLPPDYVKGADAGQTADVRSGQIEKLLSQVNEHFSRMPECLAFLVEEIQKLGRNLDTVSEKRGRLHGDRASDEFAQAQEELEAEHNRAVKMHSVLKELIVQLGRTLQLAASKGFVGADSPQQEGCPTGTAEFPLPAPSSPDGESDDLLSLGCRRQGALQSDCGFHNHQHGANVR